MRFVLLLTLIIALGCGGSRPPAAPTTTATTTTSAPAPTPGIIYSNKPEFEEMTKELTADPKSTKYKTRMIEITMKIDSIKQSGKESYLAHGKVDSTTINVTFPIQANNPLFNPQAPLLKPGHSVTFLASGPKVEALPNGLVLTFFSAGINSADMSGNQ